MKILKYLARLLDGTIYVPMLVADMRSATDCRRVATAPFIRVSNSFETPINVRAITKLPSSKTGEENAVHVGFRMPVERASIVAFARIADFKT